MFSDHEQLHADGAARQLAAIQAGGHNLVMVTRRRIAEVLDALDKGDFRQASVHLQEAQQSVGPLANAQMYVAVAEDAALVRAADLRAGMVLAGVGEVTDCEITECIAERCDGHVKIKIGDHEVEYGGDTELYVALDAADAEPA